MNNFLLDWNIATTQHRVISPRETEPLVNPSTSQTHTINIQRTDLLYPGGIDACLAIIGLGSTCNTPLYNRLIQRFGSEEQMLTKLRIISDLEKSSDIRSKTAIFFDVRAEPAQNLYARIREYVVMSQGDFHNDSVNSASIITHWIEDNSGFRVNISPLILRYAYAVIVNTLWFKDRWINEFDANRTKLLPFYTRTEIKTVFTMTQRDNIDIYEHGNIVGVKLPFNQGAVAEFMMGLFEDDAFENTYTYQNENIALYLPKFEHKAECDLSPRLSNTGYGDMFIDGNLDRLGKNKNISIRSITQIIHVRFDEEGAEVKSATTMLAIIPGITTMPKYRTIEFNRPFHYRIVKDSITLVHGYYKG